MHLGLANHKQCRVAPLLTAFLALLPIVDIGCARPPGQLFPPPATRRVWPPPPDVPRIEYVGSIASSDDLHGGESAGDAWQATFVGPRPPIRFTAPRAVAIGEGSWLAVADDAAVHVINLSQRTHRVVTGWGDQRFAAPIALVWVGGRLFVSDAQRREVIELDVEGTVHNHFGDDRLKRPVGVAYIPATRTLCVVDGGAHSLVMFGLDGSFVQAAGERGAGDGQFNYPSHISVAADRIFVTDSANFRIQTLDLEGRFKSSFGQKGDGAGDFAMPKGIAGDPRGHLYVVDARFENVQVFDADGNILMAFGEEGAGAGQFSLPAGIAVDAGGRIWVADSANGRVQVFQYLGDPS